jgi:hypothetical protein
MNSGMESAAELCAQKFSATVDAARDTLSASAAACGDICAQETLAKYYQVCILKLLLSQCLRYLRHVVCSSPVMEL